MWNGQLTSISKSIRLPPGYSWPRSVTFWPWLTYLLFIRWRTVHTCTRSSRRPRWHCCGSADCVTRRRSWWRLSQWRRSDAGGSTRARRTRRRPGSSSGSDTDPGGPGSSGSLRKHPGGWNHVTLSRDWGANTSVFFQSSTKSLCNFSGCREIPLKKKAFFLGDI